MFNDFLNADREEDPKKEIFHITVTIITCVLNMETDFSRLYQYEYK